MNLAIAKAETGRALSDAFAIARDRLPGAGEAADMRQQAFEAYERVGLPHRRIEDWKYTDLRVLMREVLPLAAAPDAAALAGAAVAGAADAGAVVALLPLHALTMTTPTTMRPATRPVILRSMCVSPPRMAWLDWVASVPPRPI